MLLLRAISIPRMRDVNIRTRTSDENISDCYAGRNMNTAVDWKITCMLHTFTVKRDVTVRVAAMLLRTLKRHDMWRKRTKHHRRKVVSLLLLVHGWVERRLTYFTNLHTASPPPLELFRHHQQNEEKLFSPWTACACSHLTNPEKFLPASKLEKRKKETTQYILEKFLQPKRKKVSPTTQNNDDSLSARLCKA